MADVPVTQTPIQLPSTIYRAPVSEALAQQMGGAINYLLDYAIPVGTIVHSMLTLAQFTSQIGSGDWLLSDGGSCVGTRYATLTGFTTVPDLRGIVLRGKNNGRSSTTGNAAGELSLGAYQADTVQAHTHSVTASHLPEVGGPVVHDDGSEFAVNGVTSTGAMNSGSSSAETRPRNVTVNVFIRVN